MRVRGQVKNHISKNLLLLPFRLSGDWWWSASSEQRELDKIYKTLAPAVVFEKGAHINLKTGAARPERLALAGWLTGPNLFHSYYVVTRDLFLLCPLVSRVTSDVNNQQFALDYFWIEEFVLMKKEKEIPTRFKTTQPPDIALESFKMGLHLSCLHNFWWCAQEREEDRKKKTNLAPPLAHRRIGGYRERGGPSRTRIMAAAAANCFFPPVKLASAHLNGNGELITGDLARCLFCCWAAGAGAQQQQQHSTRYEGPLHWWWSLKPGADRVDPRVGRAHYELKRSKFLATHHQLAARIL